MLVWCLFKQPGMSTNEEINAGAFSKMTSVVNLFFSFFCQIILWSIYECVVKHLLPYKLHFKGVIGLDRCLMASVIVLCIL